MNISICGVHEVPSYAQRDITDVISLSDNYSPKPDFGAFPIKIKVYPFDFEDTFEIGWVAPLRMPKPSHIEYLTTVIDALSPDANVLIHCTQGVCRSTAAAFLLLVRKGMSYQEAYDHTQSVRSSIQIRPNPLMIKLADIQWGHDGKMLDYVVGRTGRQDYTAQFGYTFNDIT